MAEPKAGDSPPVTPVKPGLGKQSSFESPAGIESPSVEASPPSRSFKRQGSLVDIFKTQGASTVPKPSPFKHKPVSPLRRSAFLGYTKIPRDSIERSFRDANLKRKAREDDIEARKLATKEAAALGKAGMAVDPGLTHAIKSGNRGGRRPALAKEQLEISRRHRAREEKGINSKGSNRRMLGAPVLRRDPTAPEKLSIIQHVETAVKKAGLKDHTKTATTFKSSIQEN